MKNVGSKSRAARLPARRHALCRVADSPAGWQTLQPGGWEVVGRIFLLDFSFKALARVVLGRGPSYFTISSLQLDLGSWKLELLDFFFFKMLPHLILTQDSSNNLRVLRIIHVILPEHQSDTKVFTMTMEILPEPTSNKLCGSGYQQKDRKPSQNDKTEHGMEKTVQNQGQSPKMPKSESILKNQQSNRSRN
ncbi:hypothetical protein Tco_0953891 [Tanacetum coccineum]|uniref:Uncharacterized protein n=1 Tax=Tanacetum coccineum TaxID=301880 RepID=A0ABQ5E195_9ASTR